MSELNNKMYEGRPCRKGHGTLRYKSNGQCVVCKLEYTRRHAEANKPARAAWYEENKQKVCAYQKVYREETKEERRAYSKKYAAKPENKTRHRDVVYRLTYGISLAEFDRKLALQQGKCAICGTSEPGGRGRMHVDHDHETGVVRDLLCHSCNTGIGKLKDSERIVAAALLYLQKHKGKVAILKE